MKRAKGVDNLIVTWLIAARENTSATFVFRDQVIGQALECIQQPKALIQFVEINVMDHGARQATAIDTAFDKIAIFVTNTPRGPATHIGAPLDIRPTPGPGRLSEPIRFTEFRVMAEIGIVDQLGSFERQLREFKLKLSLKAIEDCQGNKTLAARNLNISRAYLHRLIRPTDGSEMSDVACA